MSRFLIDNVDLQDLAHIGGVGAQLLGDYGGVSMSIDLIR